MLLIVKKSIISRQVSVYSTASDCIFQLSSLNLTNPTNLDLKEGPATINDGRTYACDAQIQDMAEKSLRTVPHTID